MSQSGTYILLYHLATDVSISLNSLGQIDFPAGFYCYVGSGSDNLAAGLKEFLAPVDTPYRHIDFLRQFAALEEIWFTLASDSREHVWADLLLADPAAFLLVEGFGIIDCNCESHLVYFEVRPTIEDFEPGAKYRFPQDTISKASLKNEPDYD